MLKLIILRLLERRFFWRYVGFDELSELYTSMMLRSLGLSLVGIFVPIYLYKLGYELPVILLFLAVASASRLVGNSLAGYMVALVGPKHVMLCSFISQILALLLLMSLPAYHWPLWLIAPVSGIALSLFFVAYHVDFSKIIHADHGGKELGYMTVLERLGGALGPVLGGVVATAFGARYAIGLAVIFLILAVMPLLLSAEPTRTHQKIHFAGLPFRRLRRDFLVYAMLGMENQVTLVLWPLYLAVVLFAANTYASVGLVTSVGIISAIVSARFIGTMIDRNRGGSLLRWSAACSSFLHLLRLFTGSLGGVVLMNMVYDGAATGFRLAIIKGMYARADELPGLRIVYIVWMETAGDIGKTLLWLILAGVASQLPAAETSLRAGFMLGTVASLLLVIQHFPGLDVRPLLAVRIRRLPGFRRAAGQ